MHPPETEPRRPNLLLRLSPRARLLATLLLLAGTALLPRRLTSWFLAPAAVLLLLWGVSRMPLRYTVRRLLLVEWFVLGIALLTLLSPAAWPLFCSTVIKSNLCVLTLLLLTWTTSFPELLQELRRLHLPPVMLTTLALMYRYLPVLAEESHRMQRARASRSFRRRRFPAWQELSLIVARLFARSADRAERIYLAMCARGWK
jgi:cobalt/nickel transport system permease protein